MHTAGSSSRVHRDRIVSDGGVEHGPEDEFGLALAVHALLAQLQQEAVHPACGGFAQLEPAEAGQHEAVQDSAVLVDRRLLDPPLGFEPGDPEIGEVDQPRLSGDQVTRWRGALSEDFP